jgi:hypothetical protein
MAQKKSRRSPLAAALVGTPATKKPTAKRWVQVEPGQPPVESPKRLRWVRQKPDATPDTGAALKTVGELQRALESALDKKLATLGPEERQALARSRGKRIVRSQAEPGHVPGSRDLGGSRQGLIVERADGTEVRSDCGGQLAKAEEKRVSYASAMLGPAWDGTRFVHREPADYGDENGVSPL